MKSALFRARLFAGALLFAQAALAQELPRAMAATATSTATGRPISGRSIRSSHCWRRAAAPVRRPASGR